MSEESNLYVYQVSQSGGAKSLAQLTDVALVSPSQGQALAYNEASGKWENTNVSGVGGGEANTGQNINNGGVGVYDSKSGVALRFRGIDAAGNRVSVTLDVANNTIDIDVNEENLVLNNISGTLGVNKGGTGAVNAANARVNLGVPSTTDLSNHTTATNNPHSVTAAQVGNATAQWNASQIQGRAVSSASPATGQVLKWSGSQWQPDTDNSGGGGGGSGTLDDLTDVVITSPSMGQVLKYDSVSSSWVNQTDVGESNTASNVNTSGVGVFRQKSGVNLEFRGINAVDNKVSVTLDSANNEIDIGVNEANFSVTSNLSSHVSNVSNPHSVTASQVGAATAQWNAAQIQGVSVSATAPTNGQVLKYNGTVWIPSTDNTGGGGGVLERPQFLSGTGVWYSEFLGNLSTGNRTITANTARVVFLSIRRTCAIDRIRVSVPTLTTGGLINVLLYDSNGTLLQDYGNISTNTSGLQSTPVISSPPTLDPGVYYIYLVANINVLVIGHNNVSGNLSDVFGLQSTSSSVTNLGAIVTPFNYGTAPANVTIPSLNSIDTIVVNYNVSSLP